MAAKKEFSLEEALKEIKEILQKMQMGANDFDENIKLFTRGTELIKQSREYLDAAEISVKKLVEGVSGQELSEFE